MGKSFYQMRTQRDVMRMRARHNTGDSGDIFITNIVAAIAEAERTTPSELQIPLYEAVDTDALVDLIKNGDETTRVTFQYNQLTVEVSGDREVTVLNPRLRRRMYHCVCHSCEEDELIDGFDEAQDYFNDHADRQCEVELLNTDLTQNRSTDGPSRFNVPTEE